MNKIFALLFTILFIVNLSAQVPELRIQKGHGDKVTDIVFTPNGENLITSSKDRNIIIWDTQTGKEIHRLSDHTDEVSCIDISKNGKLLISGGALKDKRVIIWNISSGTKLAELPKFEGAIIDVVFVKDEYQAVIAINKGGFEYAVQSWDLKNKKMISEFKLPKAHRIKTLAAIHSKNQVLIGGQWITKPKDKCISLFDITKGKADIDFKNTPTNVEKLFYYSKNNAFWSVGDIIKAVKIDDESEIAVLKKNAQTAAMSYSGKYICYSTGKTWNLYDVLDGKIQYSKKSETGVVTALGISPDSKLLIIGNNKGEIEFRDLESGYYLPALNSNKIDIPKQVKFGNNENALYLITQDKHFQKIDFQSGKKSKIKISTTINNPKNFITSVDFSKTGKEALVSMSLDKELIEINTKKQNIINHYKGTSYLNSGVYAKNNELIAAGGKNNKLLLWDKTNTILTNEFKGHFANINTIVFSQDNNTIYTGSNDKSIKIWKRSGSAATASINTGQYVNALALSNDNKKLIAGCGNIQDIFRSEPGILAIYNTENPLIYTGKKTKEEPVFLKGHTKAVTDVLFLKNNQFAASASADNTIKIWNTETGETINTLSDHSTTVNDIDLNKEGSLLASSGNDGSIILYDTQNYKPIISLMTFNKGDDYIFYTPENYYTCSRNGTNNIHFVQNNQVFLFEQFDLRLNRPDLVYAKIPGVSKSLIKAYYRAYLKRLKRLGFKPEDIGNDYHIPNIAITDDEELPHVTDKQLLTINIKANDNKYNLDRINIWINNVPIYGMKGLSVTDKNTNKISIPVELKLSNGINKIQVSALNTKGAESMKKSKIIYYKNTTEQKPDLYIVSIGVSKFKDADFNLDYAAKDATDITKTFKENTEKYNVIHTILLTNEEVTTEAVKNLKNKLLKTDVNDVVIVFYASHGLIDENFDYYLATHNTNFYKPSEGGLIYSDLESIIDGIPARQKIVLIDACHSGEIDKEEMKLMAQTETTETEEITGEVKMRGFKRVGGTGIGLANTFELMKELFADLQKGSGAVVISSAGGKEFALESSKWSNGVFTYSLLNGLKSQNADLNKDQKVNVDELKKYVSSEVKKLTGGKQNPTTRSENIEFNFEVY